MLVTIGLSKTHKYAVSDSGDSVDLAERPRGGISAIMADGQGSGRSAKLISSMVVGKAVSLILDGARDGAVARAVHDYLYAVRGGRVSATLTIVSVDLATKSVVISRNGHNPVYVKKQGDYVCLNFQTHPIGVHTFMRPVIDEILLQQGLIIVTYTDGVTNAGKKHNRQINQEQIWAIIDDSGENDAQSIADRILQLALELDQGRPNDDMSVLVVCIGNKKDDTIRRLQVSFPC